MKNTYVYSLVAFMTILITTGCAPKSPINDDFTEALDCPSDRGWVALKRPNSLWDVGTVLEITDNGAEDLGMISSLSCFTPESWVKKAGESASSQFSGAWRYELDLSATFAEVLKANINVGSDLDDPEYPQHSILFEVEKSLDERVDFLLLESFIEAHYEEMSGSCKRALSTANRYLVDAVLKVVKGRFIVVDNHGAKVKLSTPEIGSIQNAALKAGFKTSNSGEIIMSEDQPPMTVCARARRFDTILESIGVVSKGEESPSFHDVMKDVGLVASPK